MVPGNGALCTHMWNWITGGRLGAAKTQILRAESWELFYDAEIQNFVKLASAISWNVG